MKIDPSTGFPEVPEGYVWAVEPHEFGADRLNTLRVVLYRQRTEKRLFRSPRTVLDTVDYMPVFVVDKDYRSRIATPEEVTTKWLQRSASIVYKKLDEMLVHSIRTPEQGIKRREALERYVGQYPPKSL